MTSAVRGSGYLIFSGLVVGLTLLLLRRNTDSHSLIRSATQRYKAYILLCNILSTDCTSTVVCLSSCSTYRAPGTKYRNYRKTPRTDPCFDQKNPRGPFLWWLSADAAAYAQLCSLDRAAAKADKQVWGYFSTVGQFTETVRNSWQ